VYQTVYGRIQSMDRTVYTIILGIAGGASALLLELKPNQINNSRLTREPEAGPRSWQIASRGYPCHLSNEVIVVPIRGGANTPKGTAFPNTFICPPGYRCVMGCCMGVSGSDRISEIVRFLWPNVRVF